MLELDLLRLELLLAELIAELLELEVITEDDFDAVKDDDDKGDLDGSELVLDKLLKGGVATFDKVPSVPPLPPPPQLTNPTKAKPRNIYLSVILEAQYCINYSTFQKIKRSSAD